jgi:hypothetical protein
MSAIYWYNRRTHSRRGVDDDKVDAAVPDRRSSRPDKAKSPSRATGGVYNECEESPGVKKARLLVTRLVRKRATYLEYFEQSLERVNVALTRVQASRWAAAHFVQKSKVFEYDTSRRHGGGTTSGRVEARTVSPPKEITAAFKVAVGELPRKWKPMVKKYTRNCMAKKDRREKRSFGRLQSWEARQKKDKDKKDRLAWERMLAERQAEMERDPAEFERTLRAGTIAANRRRANRPLAYNDAVNFPRYPPPG